jgi:hypothetical protein
MGFAGRDHRAFTLGDLPHFLDDIGLFVTQPCNVIPCLPEAHASLARSTL